MLTIVMFLAITIGAKCQITFDLQNPVQTTSIGQTVSFMATIKNIGDMSQTLNALSVSTPSGLSADSSDFFNTPLSLDPGQEWNGNIFTVTVSNDAPPGSYGGEADLLWGNNNGITPAGYIVNVPRATPEPTSALLTIVGMGGMVTYARRRY